MDIELSIIIVLTLVALLTGFIDSIAGGGGLIMMPALLFAGLPPQLALGTNKIQSVFGTSMAYRNYARAGLVEWRKEKWLALLAFAGAAIGALVVQQVSARVLELIVPLFLLAVAIYVIASPRMDDAQAHQRLTRKGYAPVVTGIGFYDGFFGPGTGSFLAASLVGLRGEGLTRATGHAKLFNMLTNLGSVIVFAFGGKIIWLLGLSMAVGSMTGSWLGSRTAVKHGARLIRPLLVIISVALTARLLWGWFQA
ncbi:TSUP family transporter [Croceicoccus sp. F390]|uniref:Probable membrane transporter protein n=1 Tax=Croceicoccus esteveae TaxID=3075597 RepID=A0ABU2ZER4_9SPHN|nr:TSUP family transporter [Croceicoccus sp. F390]MDT0575092.1 TSUP family transporter [Croceicoccus sp. F390]